MIIPRGKINQREVQRASVTGLRLHSDFAVEPELEAFIFFGTLPPHQTACTESWQGGVEKVLSSLVECPLQRE